MLARNSISLGEALCTLENARLNLALSTQLGGDAGVAHPRRPAAAQGAAPHCGLRLRFGPRA